MVGRPKDRHPGGAAFVSRDTMNVVSRSRYGMKALTNMTRDVGQPRNLTVPTSECCSLRVLIGLLEFVLIVLVLHCS